MCEMIMEQVEDGYDADVDPGHLEVIFQAAEDTVEGLEEFSTSLSRAQTYAYAALEAAGMLSNKQRVTGVESFTSSISDSLKSLWAYIKKLFKGIWDFFFDGGEKKEAEEVEKKLDETAKGLKDINDGSSEEAADKAVKAAEKIANQIENNPKASSGDKAKAKAGKEKLATAKKGSKSDKKKAGKEVINELAQHNETSISKLESAYKALETNVRLFKEYIAKDRTEQLPKGEHKAGTVQYCIKEAYEQLVKDLSKESPIPLERFDPNHLKTLTDGAGTVIGMKSKLIGMIRVSNTIGKAKGELQEIIKGLEKMLNEDKKHTDYDKASLTGAKTVLSIVAGVGQFHSKQYAAYSRMDAAIKDHFGL